MKMETAKIEYEIFDCADVITTSGGGDPIPATLEMIWMSAQSVANYNAVYETGDLELVMGNYDEFNYIAFDGGTNIAGTRYNAVKGQQEKPDDEYLFVVKNSSDTVGYKRVLDWLQSRRQ